MKLALGSRLANFKQVGKYFLLLDEVRGSPVFARQDLSDKSATVYPKNLKNMELTTDNVEQVLDEMRPYLMSDGGNVELVELDGPIVKLRLQGACGTCPSSAMTLRMGIERRLREMIPEIAEVEQVV
jgi:Fe-S cluster biogenesis protein NfuA